MSNPIKVGVAISSHDAPMPEQANAMAKKTQAYERILKQYPSSSWHRSYVGTRLDPLSGFWLVEFEVRPSTSQES